MSFWGLVLTLSHSDSQIGPKSLKIFEIDHRDTQLVKRSFLKKASLDVPANVRFAQIDFEHESLSKVFVVTTFHWRNRRFFSWLGVTVYLKEAAIDAALKSMATYPSEARWCLPLNSRL